MATIGDYLGANSEGAPIPEEQKNAFETVAHKDLDPFSDETADEAFGESSGYTLNAFSAFLNTGGGKIKTKTGGGTHVTTRNGNYDFGFSRSIETASSGRLYIAPIIEYVHGSYNSSLTDGIRGEGSAKYIAGGLMVRKLNPSGLYYEGSLRGGRVKTEFASNDFIISNEKARVTYDTSAPIFSGHLRFGHLNRMNQNNLLELYGLYSYTRQNGSSTDLSSGDHVHFDSIDSNSLRLGYRMTSRTSRISRIYTGLAWQYDRAADSRVTATKYEKTSEGAKGSTGILELGWLIKPLKNNPWALDIKAVGMTGHHQGFNATAKMQKSF